MYSKYLCSQLQFQNVYVSFFSPQINTSAAKKLWEKGGSVSDMKLTPLQLHGGPEQVWRDPTWSTQGEAILAPPRRYPHDSASAGILR